MLQSELFSVSEEGQPSLCVGEEEWFFNIIFVVRNNTTGLHPDSDISCLYSADPCMSVSSVFVLCPAGIPSIY